MATKKTTTNKTEEPVEKKEVRKFAPDDLIECRSVCYGELFLPGRKSDVLYRWGNYGDVCEIEYQELRTLRSIKSGYLFKPLFVIEDEELREQWADVDEIYQKLMKVDMDKFFSLPIAQFKSKIKSLPESYYATLRNMAADKILSGELDSIAKIRALDELIGSELMLYLQ